MKNYLNEDNEWYDEIIDNFIDLPLVVVVDSGEYYPVYLDAMYELEITGLNKETYNYIEMQRPGAYIENLLHQELPILGIPENGDICYLYPKKKKSPRYSTYIYKLKNIKTKKEFIINEKGFKPYQIKNRIIENNNFDWVDEFLIKDDPFLTNKLYIIRSHKILIKIVNAFKEDKKINDPLDDGWRVTFRAFNHTPKKWEPEERIERYLAKNLIKVNYWKPISEEEAKEIFGHMRGYYEF